jgi:hypothetical protein
VGGLRLSEVVEKVSLWGVRQAEKGEVATIFRLCRQIYSLNSEAFIQ